MASSDTEARVPIALPVETNAGAAADSVEQLRDKIAASKNAIRDALSAMSDLKGKTEAVKAAKDQLTAKVEQERAAVTAASLKLLDQGTSYGKLAAQAKLAAAASAEDALAKKKETDALKEAEKAAESSRKKDEEAKRKKEELAKKGADAQKKQSDAMGKAIDAAGGPIASLKGKVSGLEDALGGAEGGMAAVAGGAALAAAAVVGLGAAIGSLAYKLGEFIVRGNDMNRILSLTRQANYGGNAKWARQLGDDIENIAKKVPIASDRVNEIATSMLKARISGQAMTDALEAISGASAAAGDDLGNKLDSIVKRGAFSKRMQISPMELMGGDLEFDDVAKALAKGMNVSVEAARAALFEGRVKLSDGAAALKKAVEDKFGAINAEKMRTIDGLTKKLETDMRSLTKDVDLSGIWKGVEKLEKNLDTSTVNGKALKGILETVGRSMGLSFESGGDAVQALVDKAVFGALKIENYWLRAEMAVKRWSGGTKTLGGQIGKGFVGAFENLVKPVTLAIDAFGAVVGAIDDTAGAVGKLVDTIEKTDFAALGKAIPEGLAKGIAGGAAALVDKVKGLGKSVKDAFKDELGIHSPSKPFGDYGENLAKSTGAGVDRGAPEAREAVRAMIQVPTAAGAGGGRSIQLTFAPQFIVQGGSGNAAEQIKQSGLLEQLWNELRAQLKAAGVEVPA